MKLEAALVTAASLSLAPLALGQGAKPPAPPPPGHGYWIQAVPQSLEEAALRDAVTRSAFQGAPEKARALAAVSAAHPGTAASGLGQLAAALVLMDDAGATLSAATATQALAYLAHADVEKIAPRALAVLTQGRAFEVQDAARAGAAFVAAADLDGTGPVACAALIRAGDAFEKAGQGPKAVAALERAVAGCPNDVPQALLRLGQVQQKQGSAKAAALAYDRLDRDFPASTQARDAAPALAALSVLLPPEPPESKRAREVRRGLALQDAAQNAPALAAFRRALERNPTGEELDLVRLRMGRALITAGRAREAEAPLGAIGSASPHAAEAAYLLARQRARRGSLAAYESVVERFPGTTWSEEALVQLANNEQKDAKDAQAVPYYRRLLKDRPSGKHTERAAWRVAFFDYREGRYEDAASLLEGVARNREQSGSTAGFLYWSGRARAAMGQVDRARSLYEETVRRFKHSYHGLRAREALPQLPAPAAGGLPVRASQAQPLRTDVPEPEREKARQLLLVDRLEEAGDVLRALPSTTVGQGTLAWIEWRRGRLRNAIIAMKRAYPAYIGEAGDVLPAELWKILFPIDYQETLSTKAGEEHLDPALVAALVCQESTFDAGAVSRVGARGLMQIMGPTGRTLARDLGVRYKRAALHDPVTSLEFGTRYLRQMLDRFGGREERALAAYNAGPHRVDAWTATRPDFPAEEFVESIPFSETRFYVMTILASREHYRRLYGMAGSRQATAASAQP